MTLETIKLQTTWNDAAGSINSNFSKILQVLASINGGGTGGGGIDEAELLEFLVENGYITEDYLADFYTKGQSDAKFATITALESLSSKIGKIEGAGYITSEALSPYLKISDADSTFATITSLGGVDERLKEIEEYFNGSGEDADNKINKWNEIVAFLNATEDTTLAGILAAYTLKTDHNALAARVKTNEDAISGINTTLGSHTSTLSEHTTAIATLGNKVNPIDTWFNEVGKFFKKDSDGVWYVDGDFYTKGQNAAGAVGSPDGGGSSGSGVMLLESWSDVPSSLSGYALSAALGIDLHERFNNYYTIGDVDSRFSGINSRLATLDSGMADRYTKAESDGRYLKLSGGTISGLLTLEPQNYHVIDIVSPDPNLAQITMSTNDILRGILQYNTNYGFGFHHRGLGGMYVNLGGEPNFVDSANNKHTLIHSGNIGYQSVASAQALKNSNGTVGATAESSGLVSFSSHIVPNNDSQAYVGVADKAWYAVYTNGLWAPSGKTLYLGANNSNHIIVNTSGNVGIGTKSPAYKLDVEGAIRANGDILPKWGNAHGLGSNFLRWKIWGEYGSFSEAVEMLSTLTVNGATTVSSTLSVASTSTFSGLTTHNAGISTPHITIGGITLSVVDGVLRIDGNVYTTGQLGVGAVGQEGGGTGGGGVLLLNNWPTDGGNSYAGYALGGNLGIDLNTRVKTLEGKATAVSFSQTLTSGKQIGVLTIDGSSEMLYAPSTYAWSEITSRPSKLSDFTDDVVSGKYLSLSGGDISGATSITGRLKLLNGSILEFVKTDSTSVMLRGNPSNTELQFYNGTTWNDVYHTGNFKPADYLPLTGGTIDGNITIGKSDNTGWKSINFVRSGITGFIGNSVTKMEMGMSDGYIQVGKDVLNFVNNSTVNTIIHSGNIGSQSVAYASNAGTLGGVSLSSGSNTPWGTIPMITEGGWMDVGKHFEFHYDNTTGSDFSTVLSCTGNYGNFVSLPSASGTLALLTDNVASATKLQTARAIWGQSFDGTGDVSGAFTTSEDFIIDTTKYSGVYWARGIVWKQNDTELGNLCYTELSDRRISIVHGAYNSSVGLHIISNGNVLIGTTTDSGAKLTVDGIVRAKGFKSQTLSIECNNEGTDYYGYGWSIDNYNNPLYIQASTSANLALCSGGGNVGIGTTNPQYKLDVAGSIRTTSSLTIGTIVLTDENGTLKIAGNAYTTGQLGAGEAGQPTSGGGSVIVDYDSIVDALGFTPAKQNDLSSLTSRVFALENAGPSSSSSSLYGDEITIGSSMGNIYISSENDVQIDTIMGSVLVNGSEVLTKANTSFTRLYTAGTKIGTIKIGGTSTDIFVPTSGSSSLWTTESDMENDIDIIASQKEYIGTNTIVGWDLAASYMSDLYIGFDGYTIWMQGSVDEASDMRLKTVIDAVNLDIRDIAFAPVFNYVFKSRPQGRQMLGSSAQYWQTIAPCAVSENDKGNLAMNYGAIALASVVAVAKKTLTHEEEIANLKLKVQDLKQRLAKYELN